jgi:hypothetical protein
MGLKLHCTARWCRRDFGRTRFYPAAAWLNARSLRKLPAETFAFVGGRGRRCRRTGARGGYRLARPANTITLLDLVEAVDGAGPAFQCREIRRCLPGRSPDPRGDSSNCFIKTRMLAAERIWRDALASQSVADLIGDGGKTHQRAIRRRSRRLSNRISSAPRCPRVSERRM